MKFLDDCSTNNVRWNNVRWNQYKQLELIPESVLNPINRTNQMTSGLNLLWRSLLALLIDELVEEQRVEYLDRCWSLNERPEQPSRSNFLDRFWRLMN